MPTAGLQSPSDPPAASSPPGGRDFLSLAFRHAPVGIAVLRAPDWRYAVANEAYCRITATPAALGAAIVGRTVHEVFPPATAQEVAEALDEIRRTGQPFVSREREADLGPGRERTWWNVHLYPLFGEGGQVVAILALVQEVTDLVLARRRAEEQAQIAHTQATEAENERRRLQAVLDALPVGVAIMDAQGGRTHANAGFEQVWGPSPPSVSSVDDYAAYKAWWADTGHPVAPEEWAAAQAVRKGEAVVGQVLEIQRFDGSRAHVINSAAPVRDAEGRVVGSAVAIQDITALHEAERATQQIALFPAQNPDPVLRIAANGALLYANEASAPVLAAWGCSVGQPAPEAWRALAGEALQSGVSRVVELPVDMRTFCIRIIPIAQENYVNLYGQDVTERRRAERALRDSEALFRAAVDSFPGGFAIYDAEQRVLFFNKETLRIVGLDQAAVVGRRTEEFLPPDVTAGYLPEFRRVYETGRPVQFERTRSDALGGASTITTFVPRLDERGKVYQVLGIAVDITDRVDAEQRRARAEEALRDSEARFRYVLENSRDALYRTNLLSGTYDYFSPTVEALTGYTPDELIRMETEEARKQIDPDDLATYNAHTRALLESCDPSPVDTVEYRWRTKEGAYRWYSNSRRLVRDPEGHPVAIVGGIRDIHEQKLAEGALERSERWVHTLIDSNIIGVAVSEMGRTVQANDAYLRIVGCSRQEMEGGAIDWQALTPAEYAPRDARGQQELRERGVCTPYEKEYQHPDGTRVPALIGAARLDREPLRWVVFNVDITERKRLELQLRALNETLEQRVVERTAQLRALAAQLARAEEQERQRLARILHDSLQQTLFAAMLQLNIAQRHAAGGTQPGIREALRLLKEAVDSSRSLTAELSPAILHQDGLIPALHWLGRRVKERYGLDVTVQITEDAALRRIPEDVAVVLYHGASELLFNVYKHAGVQTAHVELAYTVPDGVRLTVADEGCGFDMIQTSASGFGLVHVQERILYAGGQCVIESAPGSGTRVTLSLPFLPDQASISARDVTAVKVDEPAKASTQRKLRLVLVDDHAIVRKGLVQLLSAEPDLEVVGESGDGVAGIALVRAVRPDVVLMDISMPRMDGIEATRRLLAELPSLSVIGLSMFEDEEKAGLMRQAGAVAYVAKGGPPESLIAAIRACRSPG